MADVKNVSGAFTGSYAKILSQGKYPNLYFRLRFDGVTELGAVMAVPAHDERDHRFAKNSV